MKFLRIMTAASIATAILSGCATDRLAHTTPFSANNVLYGTQTDKDSCEKRDQTVWVTYNGKSECIKYYGAGLTNNTENVVVHFHGDVAWASFKRVVKYVLPQYTTLSETHMKQAAKANFTRNSMPFIFIGRPGTFGSTGFHGDRYSELNPRLLNEAIDAIKTKHNISALSLSGQSGGGVIVASLLNWRNDIKCAVLASSNASHIETFSARNPQFNYDKYSGLIYDPSKHIEEIQKNPNRNIIVIADKEDDIVKNHAQKSYADKVKNAGHNASFMNVNGGGRDNHSLAGHAVKIASMCAKNRDVTNYAATTYAPSIYSASSFNNTGTNLYSKSDFAPKKARKKAEIRSQAMARQRAERKKYFQKDKIKSPEEVQAQYHSLPKYKSVNISWHTYMQETLIRTWFRLDKNTFEGNFHAGGLGFCTGTYKEINTSNGSWSLTCPNNVTAKGNFHYESKTQHLIGQGSDNNGNKIKLSLKWST